MHKCSGRIFEDFRDYPCSNSGRLFEDHRWWCRIHAPSKVAERKKKSMDRFEEKWAAMERNSDKNKARQWRIERCVAACDGVPDEQLTPGLVARLLSTSEGLTDNSVQAPKTESPPSTEKTASASRNTKGKGHTEDV